MSNPNLARRHIQARDQLRIEQAMWMPLWRDATAFCCPHKQKAVDNSYAQLTQQVRPRFNPTRQSSTAIDALNVLSGGCRSWLIPGGDEGWGGQWQPHQSLEKSAAVKDWYVDCTQRSLAPLERGGFFTAGHEMFQDLGVFGTTGFLIDEGDAENPLYCQALMPTNFVFERDWTGQVTRVIITWSKPASLIVDQFNQPGDDVPEQVKTDAAANNGQTVHELIQCIYRRTDAEMGEHREHEPAGQRIGACWVHVALGQVIRERGYMEMPFSAPRWNTWAGTGPSNYGTSPAMQALADCKGLNLLDMVIATRAEIEINPRVKVMPDQTGAIDLSPGGVTQMNSANSVSEWAVAGSYPIGKDQIDVIERRINRAFFKDLFEAVTPLAQAKGDLTNYVAQAVQQEAAARITPAMSRVEQDFFQTAMHRVFMLLLRAGVFEDPPEDAFHYDKAGQGRLILPRTVQSNRMVRATNGRKSFAFTQSMGRALQIAQVKPEIFDLYDFEAIQRDLDRGDGMPQEWKLTEPQIEKLRSDRAAAAQQALVQQTAAAAISSHPEQVAQIAGLGPQAA